MKHLVNEGADKNIQDNDGVSECIYDYTIDGRLVLLI